MAKILCEQPPRHTTPPPRMPHTLSEDDLHFRREFAAFRIPPAAFDHRAHLRLAYGFLVELDDDAALAAMRDTLLRFLAHFGIDPAKYHATLTAAWLLAVRHFLVQSPPCASADDFLRHNARLLDGKLLLAHYSEQVLASPAARATFVPPDRDAIPRHPR